MSISLKNLPLKLQEPIRRIIAARADYEKMLRSIQENCSHKHVAEWSDPEHGRRVCIDCGIEEHTDGPFDFDELKSCRSRKVVIDKEGRTHFDHQRAICGMSIKEIQ